MEQVLIATLIITSPAFTENGTIPAKYTCDGQNVNPELHIEGIPGETKSLALIMDDPDAPGGTFDHWISWNMLPQGKLAEDSVTGTQGVNSFGKRQYNGPCPPHGKPHRYSFRVYALDCTLDLLGRADKRDLMQSMDGHILAEGEIVGVYQRK